jgi:integrase
MAQLLKRGKVYYSDLRFGKKRVRRALSTDRRVAEEKLAELVKLRGAEKRGEKLQDLSWELFRAKYLTWSRGEKRGNSPYRDELAFRYLEGLFHIQSLSNLKPELLDSFKHQMQAKGKGAATINRSLNSLVAAMHKAEEWGYIAPRAWNKVKRIKTTEARDDFYSIEELSKIIKSFSGKYRTMAFLGGRAGLRLGEMNFLTFDDIDWRTKRIHVTAKPPEWNPKDYEKRFIPMSSDLMEHLASLPRTTRFVLGDHRHEVHSLSALLIKQLVKLKMRGSCHTLRHTYASHLAMAGVDMKTLSLLLGHSSVRTTERHYAHLSKSHLDETALKMPALA